MSVNSSIENNLIVWKLKSYLSLINCDLLLFRQKKMPKSKCAKNKLVYLNINATIGESEA